MADSTHDSRPDSKPTGFFDDLVHSILNPGYVGSASLLIINVALILVAVFIAVRILSDPRGLGDIENSIHLFALIPCVGLLFSINWYAYMVASIKAAEAKDAGAKKKNKKQKKKKTQ